MEMEKEVDEDGKEQRKWRRTGKKQRRKVCDFQKSRGKC